MINRVYIFASTANLASFICGTSLSWSSPIIPKFNVTDIDEIPFGRITTLDENSWIVALLSLGAIFGPFIYGYLADRIGRKFTVMALGVPYLISYFILAFAEIVPLYYVARFLIGLSIGGGFTVIPMYIGEIAEDSNRGALGSLMNCFLTFGLLFSYSIGPYISIMIFNIILAVVPGLFIIIFYFIAPESPYYHIAKGDDAVAKKCLETLRGIEKTDKEFDEIKTSISKNEKATFLDLFKSKSLIKALIISSALVGLQQLSGINAILFYAQEIFEASGGQIKPEISSIIIGAIIFVSSFVTPLFVDRFGRKLLLYISALGMIISEIPIGVYFYLKDDNQNVDSISWLPIVGLVVYIITYNAGFGPLPWVVMGELFPSNVKSAASSLTAAFCWMLSFFITKFFTNMADAIGMGPSFWFFAGFCIIAFFFVLFFVIETKGKSFQEIQQDLQK